MPATNTLYLALYEEIKQAIREGTLREGERLPSSRELAATRGVSRTTATCAYDQLLSEGYIASRRGSGCYVASPLPGVDFPDNPGPNHAPQSSSGGPALSNWGATLMRCRPARGGRSREVIDFQYGDVELDEKSRQVWARLARHWAYRQSRSYGDTLGLPALRGAISSYLQLNRGCRGHTDQIAVTSGGQQAFDLITRLMISPGDPVALENPGYARVKHLLQALGARLLPIGVDAEGLRVEELPNGKHAPRLVFVTPSHQFPSGSVMSLRRRLALLEWAHTNNAWIVEDDYDSEFRYRGRPIESLQGLDDHGRVLYVGTFSKVLFPALKLGYVLLPHSWMEPFTYAKQISDRHSPWLEQHILADFIQQGHFERHLRRMRRRYAQRQHTLVTMLHQKMGAGEIAVEGENAGLHLVCWLPGLPPHRLPALIDNTFSQGVRVYPIGPLYEQEPAVAGLLLGFATLNERQIETGVEVILHVLHALHGEYIKPRERWTKHPPAYPPTPNSYQTD